MTTREYSALISMILVIVGTCWYIHLIVINEKVSPVIGSWIINCGATLLSLFTYLTTPKHSLVSNATNTISVVTISSILAFAWWYGSKRGKKVTFNPFQKWSLFCSLMIALLWIVIVWGYHRTGILPNILTQVMMLVGYAVTAERLLHAEKNTESLFTWWCILAASLVGLITGILSDDMLAILFTSRTFIGTAVLVTLMHRLERRS